MENSDRWTFQPLNIQCDFKGTKLVTLGINHTAKHYTIRILLTFIAQQYRTGKQIIN